ncbi:BZ3500_MvSof-1268-A1-R1_Chr11-2g03417 [Microbotryum saponariae]|uniref:BZ3500_MvSof-1268-A1-R1_Chr11-2g03417 protein n=1 Tax=Microbotryum saponariae TaxID=289078 RepID=A0A2X0N7S9_9BASI|nr:BZ3500_MvSof-1268-A1-R1_Chr11-2g03417 [Microbotryum saponariae]SDA03332.1 BZ3501_MvSof-1269-A2-R1_Chr11g02988 [Microbotryum saponariae]
MLGFAASSGSSSSPSSTSSSMLRLKVKRSEPLPTYSGPNQIPPSYEQATGKKTIRSPTPERTPSSLSYWLDLVVSQREAQAQQVHSSSGSQSSSAGPSASARRRRRRAAGIWGQARARDEAMMSGWTKEITPRT